MANMDFGKKHVDLIHDAVVELCEKKELRLGHKTEDNVTNYVDVIFNLTNGKPVMKIYSGVYGFSRIEEYDDDASSIFIELMKIYYSYISERKTED